LYSLTSVASIGRAVPWLVAVSARRPRDEMIFGKIGHAFIPSNRCDASEADDFEDANNWSFSAQPPWVLRNFFLVGDSMVH